MLLSSPLRSEASKLPIGDFVKGPLFQRFHQVNFITYCLFTLLLHTIHSIAAYRLTSSDKSSSDESKNAELLQLQALLRKRRTSSVMFQTQAECFEHVGFQSNFHDLQTEPKQEKGEAAETEEATEESNDSQQTRDNCSVPISNLKVWKQSHALDQKELPLEM